MLYSGQINLVSIFVQKICLIVQILGRASPSVPKKSKLPPRPDDYDEYWYQDESGEWRNEYDDEGRAQPKDVNSVIEIKTKMLLFSILKCYMHVKCKTSLF